jgi:threonine synthase
MRYMSTRGQSAEAGFIDVLLAGLAPDGGLYVPVSWPRLPDAVLQAAATAPYAQTAAAVLKLFAGDNLDEATCALLADEAYGGQWANPAVTPVVQTGPGDYILELFHGPSLAFKDVAMQLLAGLYAHVLEQRGTRLTVVCATSGDTGGAAVEALKSVDAVDLFVLLPDGRVSDVQRRFMTGSGSANVHPVVVDGDFDAAQAVVKALFADRTFAADVALTPVNSINWARILAQSVYYVVTSCALSSGGPVNFTVPSGNFGDALAGWVARAMGAPVGRIMIATNANDGIARVFTEGRYTRTAASTATLSPAMDISVASNFERIMFEAVGRDPVRLKALYDVFAQSGSYAVDEDAMAFLTSHFDAFGVDDDETRWAMGDALDVAGQVLCPHTAVGWRARFGADEIDGARVLLATAHPAKFPETVLSVLGRDVPLPAHCADLFNRQETLIPCPADPAAVKSLIKARRHV